METYWQDKEHWIFDMDGTLTVPIHNFDEIRKALDIPNDQDILEFLDSLPEEEARKRHDLLEKIEIELASQAIPMKGLKRLMEVLASKNVKMGVLTRNTRENALITLEAIGVRHLFSAENILGRDEALPKPDPDGVLKLLGQWQANAETSVMVGNYIHDLESGKKAKTSTVLIDHLGEFLWPDMADLMVKDLEELADKIACN